MYAWGRGVHFRSRPWCKQAEPFHHNTWCTLFKLVHLPMPNFWSKNQFWSLRFISAILFLLFFDCIITNNLYVNEFSLRTPHLRFLNLNQGQFGSNMSRFYSNHNILWIITLNGDWRTSVQAGSTCVHMYHPRMPCALHSLGHDTHNSPGGNGPVGWWGNQLIEFDDDIMRMILVVLQN